MASTSGVHARTDFCRSLPDLKLSVGLLLQRFAAADVSDPPTPLPLFFSTATCLLARAGSGRKITFLGLFGAASERPSSVNYV
jgi:hypothetical protein